MTKTPRSLPPSARGAKLPEAPKAQVPEENVEILREVGLDPTSPPDRLRASIMRSVSTSISLSPYPSAEMLKDYVDADLEHVAKELILRINQQMEHRQDMERREAAKSANFRSIGQYLAILFSTVVVLGSLYASYKGVAASVCMSGIIMGVGGPSTATVFARVLDRSKEAIRSE